MNAFRYLLAFLVHGGNRSHRQLAVRSRVLALFTAILAIVLLAVFCRVLLDTPTRTPLLLISSEYLPPFDLNPWRTENLQAIESLDRHNLTVETLSHVDDLIKGRWNEFESAITQLDHIAPKDKPLLLYVNLHGAVDENEQPCLLVSDSSPLDTETWLPLQTLLERIASSLKKDRAIVLFLESGRHSPALTHANQFSSAVQKLVDSNMSLSRITSLSVLLSSTSNSPSIDPIEGQPDPFTRMLSQSLAGSCDSKLNGGNGNQQVELFEIEKYMRSKSQEYAALRSTSSPLPKLFTNLQHADHDRPFVVTWAIANSVSKRPIAPGQTAISARDIEQSHRDMEATWRTIESLRSKHPWHEHPVEWAKLVYYAVCIEEATFGGVGEAKRAAEWKKQFRQLATEIQDRTLSVRIATQSLALQHKLSQNAQQMWLHFASSPTLGTALQITRSALPTEIEAVHTAVPFLTVAASQPELPIWKEESTLQKFATAMTRVEKLRQQCLELPDIHEIDFRETELDRQCRSIADRMLLGDSESSLNGSTLSSAINKFSDAVDAWDRRVAWLETSFQAHESAAAELPLLSCVCDSIDSINSVGSSADTVTPQLSDLVDRIAAGLKENVQFLTAASEDPVRVAIPIPSELQMVDVSSELSQLKQELSTRWRRLLESEGASQPGATVALQLLLRSGFLPSENEPFEKAIQLRIATRKFLSHSPRNSVIATPTLAEQTKESFLCRLAVRRLITGDRNTTTFVPSPLETIRPTHEAEDARTIAARCLDVGLANKPSSERVSSEFRARIVASITLDPRCNRVTDESASLQAKKKMLRGCFRFTEDFWNQPQIQSLPYFEAVTQRLLAEVHRSNESELSSSTLQQAIAALGEKRDAATNSLTLQAAVVPAWQADAENVVNCEVAPGNAASKLPEGLASLQIIGTNQVPVEISPAQPVVLGPKMNRQTITSRFASADPTASGPLKARLLFRGHSFETSFPLVSNSRNVSVAEFADSGPATILVNDQRPKRRARVLILDCSASMIDAQPIEGQPVSTDAPDVSNSKLAAARRAVAEILGRWRGSSDQIGVILFGHRAAISDTSKGTLLQERYYAKFPFDRTLRAFEDVETVLSVGKFADEEFSEVLNRLEQLLPWGQTPLYLAIQQAIAQFEHLGGNHVHDVIVISDGKNYQFNPTDEKNILIDTVIGLAKQQKVRIHIIGFGVPVNERAEAWAQYQRLANETGGTTTMDVAQAIDLVRQVEAIAEPETFTVQLPTGESWRGESEKPLTIPAQLRTNTPVRIEYRNQQLVIPVSPRSAIRLMADFDSHLISARYADDGEPEPAAILNANQLPSPFLLGLHPPRKRESTVAWTLSLQRTDGSVAQRPKYVWVEVLPMTADTTDPASLVSNLGYYISDATWKPDAAIPVLQFETKNWPPTATASMVQFWCTDIEPQVLDTHEVDLAQLDAVADKNLKPSRSIAGEVKGTNLRYQIYADAQSLTVVMIDDRKDHNNNNHSTSDISSIAPALECDVSARLVERQYRVLQGMSVHRFVFPATATDNPTWRLAGSPKIKFMNIADVKLKGLQLAKPLKTSLESTMATLPTSPPPVLKR